MKKAIKVSFSIGATFLLLFLVSGCTLLEETDDEQLSRVKNEIPKDSETANSVKNVEEKEIMSAATPPPMVVYKTRVNYNNFVHIGLSEDKSKVMSYPDPKDVYYNGQLAYPTELSDGYLLDNRGIFLDSAFLNITFEEYSKLDKAPSVQEILDMVIDDNPLLELYSCGARGSDAVEKMNEIIDNNQLDTICGAVTPPSKTHFETVWHGNGYKHMTIFVNQAYLGGTNIPIVAGDEIGVFDGDLCVGIGVLRGPIVDVFQVNASADDPTTSEIDGFIEGHPIKYKLWRFGNAYEFTNVMAEYNSTLDNIFVQLGTAMVSLKGELHPDKAEQLIKEDGIIEINCAEEGERPTYFDLTTGKENSGGKHCCFGLKEIGPKTPQEELEKGICMGVSGSLGICSPCGNNVCESEYEDSCNCPEDCGRK